MSAPKVTVYPFGVSGYDPSARRQARTTVEYEEEVNPYTAVKVVTKQPKPAKQAKAPKPPKPPKQAKAPKPPKPPKQAKAPKPPKPPKPVTPEGMKKCSVCDVLKPVANFYRMGVSYHSWCKECTAKKRGVKTSKVRRYVTDTEAQCTKCKAILPHASFYAKRTVSSWCRPCHGRYQTEMNRAKNGGVKRRPGRAKDMNGWRKTGVHECKECHQTLPISEFYLHDGHTSWRCKECSRQRAKAARDLKNGNKD